MVPLTPNIPKNILDTDLFYMERKGLTPVLRLVKDLDQPSFAKLCERCDLDPSDTVARLKYLGQMGAIASAGSVTELRITNYGEILLGIVGGLLRIEEVA